MITNREFADLLADPTKEITGDILWTPSASHPWVQEFVVAVESPTRWPLRVEAWLNPRRSKLSYALIHNGAGRIVGLDLGADVGHHNPDCRRTRASKRRCGCPRGLHKHAGLRRTGRTKLMSRRTSPPHGTTPWASGGLPEAIASQQPSC